MFGMSLSARSCSFVLLLTIKVASCAQACHRLHCVLIHMKPTTALSYTNKYSLHSYRGNCAHRGDCTTPSSAILTGNRRPGAEDMVTTAAYLDTVTESAVPATR